MKKIYYLGLAALLAVACKKENTGTHSSGNIVRATVSVSAPGPAGVSITAVSNSPQDSVTVAGLMKSNNLPTDGFVFYGYQSYNALDQSNQMGFYQITMARQVRNGLTVFFEDLMLGFENGKLNGPYPASQFIAGNISLDNKPNLALSTLRDAFIKLDNSREATNISIGDSTLVAQLGYYNLNVNRLADGVAPQYVKMWYVHPQHSPLPYGFFRDDDGSNFGFNPLTHSGPQAP